AGYSFSHIVKHLATFQSDVISEKTKKGLSKAKQKGVTAGRPRKPDENVQRAIQMYESKKYSLAEMKSETGISKATLYTEQQNLILSTVVPSMKGPFGLRERLILDDTKAPYANRLLAPVVT